MGMDLEMFSKGLEKVYSNTQGTSIVNGRGRTLHCAQGLSKGYMPASKQPQEKNQYAGCGMGVVMLPPVRVSTKRPLKTKHLCGPSGIVGQASTIASKVH
jgi:hypothetical protein